MIDLNMKNIVKYSMFMGLIFVMLKYIIKPKINNDELSTEFLFLLSIIVTLVFIIADYLTNLTSDVLNINNSGKEHCTSVCSIKNKKENMENILSENDNNSIINQSSSENLNIITPDERVQKAIIDRKKDEENFNKNLNRNMNSDVNANINMTVNTITQEERTQKDETTLVASDNISSLISDSNELMKKLDDQRKEVQNQIAKLINEKKKVDGLLNFGQDTEYLYPYMNKSQFIRSNGNRANDGVLKDETKYSVQNYHLLPQNQNTGSFEYGYSFLPPEKWFPVPPFPPVCVTEKQCPVCPTLSSSDSVNLKDWDDSRRVTPPDQINVDYITDKLNSGR